MIKTYSLKALERALHHALALDETTPLKLAKLENKVLEISINPLGVNFFIHFEKQRLKLLANYEGAVDTLIQSSPLGLIRLSFLPASKARSLFNDKIKLSGDVELGQQVKQLFDELDIDWEAHLAHFTGDVVAYGIGSLLRQGISFQKEVRTRFKSNTSAYIQEELRWLPPREEINDFFSDIDQLALDTERLQAHINQLVVTDETD